MTTWYFSRYLVQSSPRHHTLAFSTAKPLGSRQAPHTVTLQPLIPPAPRPPALHPAAHSPKYSFFMCISSSFSSSSVSASSRLSAWLGPLSRLGVTW